MNIFKKLFKRDNEEKIDNSAILLREEEIDKAIIEYYDDGLYPVNVKKEITKKEDKVNIDLYVTQEIAYGNKKKIIETKLTEDDLINVFSYLLRDTSFYAIGFEYIDSVKKLDTNFNDVPRFNGIKLLITEKAYEKKRK